MLDPSLEYLSPEERRKNPQYTPGLFVAMALNEAWTKTDKPLSEEERQDAAAVLSQAGQAATPVPGFLWKRLFLIVFKYVRPGYVAALAIALASYLPYFVYINATELAALLDRLGVLRWLANLFT